MTPKNQLMDLEAKLFISKVVDSYREKEKSTKSVDTENPVYNNEKVGVSDLNGPIKKIVIEEFNKLAMDRGLFGVNGNQNDFFKALWAVLNPGKTEREVIGNIKVETDDTYTVKNSIKLNLLNNAAEQILKNVIQKEKKASILPAKIKRLPKQAAKTIGKRLYKGTGGIEDDIRAVKIEIDDAKNKIAALEKEISNQGKITNQTAINDYYSARKYLKNGDHEDSNLPPTPEYGPVLSPDREEEIKTEIQGFKETINKKLTPKLNSLLVDQAKLGKLYGLNMKTNAADTMYNLYKKAKDAKNSVVKQVTPDFRKIHKV